jgi:hypothetical protein
MDSVTPTGGIRRFLAPKFIIPALIAAAALVAVILIWFQPQKLFIDTQVNEEAPGAMKEEDSMAKDDAMMKDDEMMKEDAMAKDEAMMSFSGDFRGLDHETSGKALLEKAPDGHYYIRFENFSTENGPDLFVYLSTVPGDANESDFPGEFIDLGKLKGNMGNQNYLVPDGTDLSKYHSVIIWCRRFNTTFGASPLDQA